MPRILSLLKIIVGLAIFASLIVLGTKVYYGQIVPAAQGLSSFGTLPILGFSILGGMIAFFAPCPVSVFPAYVGLFLAAEDGQKRSFGRALRFGITAAVAIILFYAVLGGVLAAVGTAAARYVLQAKLYIVLLIALLGIFLLFDIRIPTGGLDRLSRFLSNGMQKTSSMLEHSFLYGLLYAVGGAACFLPLLLTIALTPILSGNYLTGFLAFLGYGGGLGLMLILATLLIEEGRMTLLKGIIRRSGLLKRLAGGLLLLAAASMGIFYIVTGM